MSFVRCALIALSLSILSSFARADGAQEATHAADAAEPAGYAQTISAALSEFELGNMTEARTLLLKAHALYATARTERALGMVEFELRNYTAAIAYLELALRSQIKPLDAALRTETEGLLRRARDFTGTIVLRVTPSTASVRLDAVDVDLSRQAALLVNVGDHTIEVSAPGYPRETRRVRVEANRSERVTLVLQKSESARPLYKNPWLWTSVAAVVVAGAVTGTVLGLKARDVGVERANGGTTGAVLVGPTQGEMQ